MSYAHNETSRREKEGGYGPGQNALVARHRDQAIGQNALVADHRDQGVLDAVARRVRAPSLSGQRYRRA